MADEIEVVVEAPPAAPPQPQYVTSGELDAKLELFREQVGQTVSEALKASWEARDAAERAADDAAVAQAQASTAVDIALETAEAVDDQEQEPPVEGGPKAPQPRSESTASTTESAEKPKPQGGYGNSAFFKR